MLVKSGLLDFFIWRNSPGLLQFIVAVGYNILKRSPQSVVANTKVQSRFVLWERGYKITQKLSAVDIIYWNAFVECCWYLFECILYIRATWVHFCVYRGCWYSFECILECRMAVWIIVLRDIADAGKGKQMQKASIARSPGKVTDTCDTILLGCGSSV